MSTIIVMNDTIGMVVGLIDVERTQYGIGEMDKASYPTYYPAFAKAIIDTFDYIADTCASTMR